jgi:16S rRNA (adenine1518-N6/adenine1519-N6)-dimethyltransferase
MKGARRLVDSLRARQPFKKELGQHFLVHDDILERTVEWAEVDVEDHVLEVGPGPGVLTEALLATGCAVTAIE